MLRNSLRICVPLAAGLLLMFAGAGRADAIVGGTTASADRWPWMVGVLSAYTRDAMWAQYCGGVVIAPRRVLTAAHCVVNRASSDVEVLIGRTRLSANGGRRVRVTAIAVHPRYETGEAPNLDAAVLILASDAGVAPLALAQRGQNATSAPGTQAWAIGWGALNGRPSPGRYWYYADRLRELQVPIQGDDACENAFGVGFIDYSYVASRVLCAGTTAGVNGTCWGDSGGPLVVSGPTGWIHVGIVTGGDGCASRGYYDLYTRTDAISQWALASAPSARASSPPRPRIAGRLVPGKVVRCRSRRESATHSVHWHRLGDRSGRVLAHGRTYRLTAQDAHFGVTCTVTAVTRDGRGSATARPLRPAT